MSVTTIEKGVSCAQCASSVRALDIADEIQKNDGRLGSIRHCRNETGHRFNFSLKQDAHFHACNLFKKTDDLAVVDFRPAAVGFAKLNLEQSAQEPSNDLIFSKANAHRLFLQMLDKTLSLKQIYQEIELVKQGSKINGDLLKSAFDKELGDRDRMLKKKNAAFPYKGSFIPDDLFANNPVSRNPLARA